MKFIKLRDCPEASEYAARWFSEKWGIPAEVYLDSMRECIKEPFGIPQWYIVINEHKTIVAGAGTIENDFHERKDLTPNLCALYVEEEYRGRGIARDILNLARTEAGALGFSKLYLITDHTAFYEKCGWEFLTVVTSDENTQERMYVSPTDVS